MFMSSSFSCINKSIITPTYYESQNQLQDMYMHGNKQNKVLVSERKSQNSLRYML